MDGSRSCRGGAALASVSLVLLLWSPVSAGTYFVDGACAASGTGTSLDCGPGGPFATVMEGIAALAADVRAGKGGSVSIRGAHDGFDGRYNEYLGLWGENALNCTAAQPCVVQGCPAVACGRNEMPVVSGLVRRTDWIEASPGSGIWYRQMEARRDFVSEPSSLRDEFDPGYLLQGDGVGDAREFLQYSLTGATPGDGRWFYDAATHRAYVNPRGAGNPKEEVKIWVPDRAGIVVAQGIPGACPAGTCPPFNNVTVRRLRLEGGRSVIVEINSGYEDNGRNIVLDTLRLAYATRYGLFGQKLRQLTVSDVIVEHMGRGMSSPNEGSFPLRLLQVRGGRLTGVTTRHAGSAGFAGGCGAQSAPRPFLTPPWDAVAGNPVCGMGISKILQSQRLLLDGFRCADMSLGCLQLDNVSDSVLQNCHIAATYSGISLTDWTAAPAGVDSLSRNNVVRDCRIDDTGWDDYGAINVEPTDDPLGAGDFLVKIYRNVITRSSRAGILLSRYQTPATTMRKVFIRNNTVWQDRARRDYPCAGWCPWDTSASGVDFDSRRLSRAAEIEIRNNIFKDLGHAGIAFGPRAGAGVVIDHNLYANADGEWTGAGVCPPWVGTAVRWQNACYATLATFREATGHEAHGMVADPLFVDPGRGDLRLCRGVALPAGCKGASPAIDRGTPVGLDYRGAAPDLGAIEAAGPGAELSRRRHFRSRD